MDLDELRSVKTRERATDGLQDLRESFYEDVSTYLDDLRENRREAAAAADDPFRSPEVNELTDEIETAEQVAEAIYERRIGKLLKEASLVASGMAADPDGLTTEEQELYRTIVDLIEENKSLVLDAILGEDEGPTGMNTESTSPTDESLEGGETDNDLIERPPQGQVPDEEVLAGTASGDRPGASADEDLSGDDPDVTDDGGGGESETIDRTKVRITEDVGEILGVDRRSYSLLTDDVVDLPEENAGVLLNRDAAERLE